jgi:hypothetical protein
VNDFDDESSNYSSADAEWRLTEHKDDNDERAKQIRYLDLKNLRVQNVGQKILDSALEAAKQDNATIDSLWNIFLDHIQSHLFAEEIARQIEDFKSELEVAIKKDCYPQLEKAALLQVKKEVREQVEKELTDEARKTLTPLIQSSIKNQLEKEFEFSLRPIIADKLKRDLEPSVREELREKLLKDPDFINEVRSELKKKILGI